MAGRLGGREMERAIAVAERRELTSCAELDELVRSRSRRRGVRRLRELIRARERLVVTRSAAEERFLELVRAGRLPHPEVNVRFGQFELDFLWRPEGVAVEIDGFEYHGSRRGFEQDRRRDARLAAVGVHVVRVTWRQLDGEPDAVLVHLAQTLARAEHRREAGTALGHAGSRRGDRESTLHVT
jgi:very-short-patch-repair endonuclease